MEELQSCPRRRGKWIRYSALDAKATHDLALGLQRKLEALPCRSEHDLHGMDPAIAHATGACPGAIPDASPENLSSHSRQSNACYRGMYSPCQTEQSQAETLLGTSSGTLRCFDSRAGILGLRRCFYLPSTSPCAFAGYMLSAEGTYYWSRGGRGVHNVEPVPGLLEALWQAAHRHGEGGHDG